MLRSVKRNGSKIPEVQNKIQRTMNKTLILPKPIQSKSDKKIYRQIKLENGLSALLIHHDLDEKSSPNHRDKDDIKKNQSESSVTSDEENTDGDTEEEEEEDNNEEREKLAAVSLCIGTGSFQDPLEFQGLAHFVEHMIFMGSKKFPKENELDEFLAKKGGGSNAMTECEHTLFYFDIVEEYLNEAVDRFSSLFVSPLMNRESMMREIEAVESEFQNNINDDDNRIVQIFATKASERSAAQTFTWGNLKSLKDDVNADKLYEAAHEFRKKYYVANNMFLCIESAADLDELQAIVEKYFSEIVNANLVKEICTVSASEHFKLNFYDEMLYVKPKGDRCKLIMTFVMPSMEKHYKTKPHDYIAYIIQHEGVGTLSSYLKRK